MRFLVTGATGFVGGALARQLRAAGHDVVALVRRPAAHLAGLGVDQRPGDITDRESVRAAMAGVDGVFHAAAWYKIGGDRAEAHRVNVEGTRVVLEAMRDAGVPKGVYTSTLAVFGDTRGRVLDETHRSAGPPRSTAYDETKWRAHYEIAAPLIAQGLPLVVVQPGVVYGVGDHSPMRPVIDRYLRRRLPAVTPAAYCWGHVEDTALAHRLAMDRGRIGEDYIIAGPPHSLAEALRIAESVTGIPAPRVVIPGLLLAIASGSMGGMNETLRVAGATYLGSNAKARRELGYDPRPLRDGFAQVLPAHLAALQARA